ncbi:hypothetical protein RRG08_016682 [Elysia crispata]|uniref:Uncharacterized protein n=1 Tax=Elysia crispata TaxID=231223 RepID=A0AAE1AJ88_9GAST|nr:hypothetical protein RRG08_016682 [Elysia crispata]
MPDTITADTVKQTINITQFCLVNCRQSPADITSGFGTVLTTGEDNHVELLGKGRQPLGTDFGTSSLLPSGKITT